MPTEFFPFPSRYSHNYEITALEAYLDLYVLTGEERFLTAVLAAWDMWRALFVHVGGSIAVNEYTYYPPVRVCELATTCLPRHTLVLALRSPRGPTPPHPPPHSPAGLVLPNGKLFGPRYQLAQPRNGRVVRRRVLVAAGALEG